MDAPFEIPESDADLLAACDVETFRSGGPGGQHQNVTDSGVRLRHRASGLVVTSRARRSQHLNKQECLRRLRLRLAALNAPPPPPRTPTRPSPGAVERRLEGKARRGAAKRLRRPPGGDD
jgi:ribosome-associated protein